MIWDHGSYANRIEREMTECVRRSHLGFQLHGEKLRAGDAKTRRGHRSSVGTRNADGRRKPVKSQPGSVLSGRTLDELS